MITLNNSIFDFFYTAVLGDATNRVLQSGKKKLIAQNTSIRLLVKTYAENVINGRESNFYELVQDIYDCREGVDDLTFGHIQKLINMTMKYLYASYYRDKDIRPNFRNCHAPLDRVMRDYVYEKYKLLFTRPPGFRKSISWSRLSFEDIKIYKSYQHAVDVIIKQEKKNMMPIEFDYVAWKKDPLSPIEDFGL